MMSRRPLEGPDYSAQQDRAPTVSVLLPVYNGARSIARAVDSILSQTFTDFELVVIDDGSNDETPERLRALATGDKRMRVETHPQNLGLVASLNHGLDLCRGHLVARLDADDMSFPTRIREQVDLFRARSNLVLCATAYERCSEHGERIRVGVPPQTHAGLSVAMLVGNRVSHSAVMFNRRAALEVGGYDPNWFPVEDYDLWLRLMEVGEYCGVPSVQGRNFYSCAGVSASHARHQQEVLAVRSRQYRDQLVFRRRGDSPLNVRDVSRAVRTLRSRLTERGLETAELYPHARLVANAILRDRKRLDRRARLLLGAPAIAFRGRRGARR